MCTCMRARTRGGVLLSLIWGDGDAVIRYPLVQVLRGLKLLIALHALR